MRTLTIQYGWVTGWWTAAGSSFQSVKSGLSKRKPVSERAMRDLPPHGQMVCLLCCQDASPLAAVSIPLR